MAVFLLQPGNNEDILVRIGTFESSKNKASYISVIQEM